MNGLFRIAKKIIISPDFLIAIIVTVLIRVFLSEGIFYNAAKDIFEVSISTLSIVFSIYFVALTVLITSGDNEFIKFVEEGGLYSRIIYTSKITLFILFLSLILSIVLYVSVLNHNEGIRENLIFPVGWLAFFSFWSMYSLLATVQSILDAIRFAEYRVKFIKIVNSKREQANKRITLNLGSVFF